MPNTVVTSFEDWLKLPEVAIPKIASSAGSGSVYRVHKVGFLLAKLDPCPPEYQSAEQAAGKRLLPTAVVDFDGAEQLCKLPIELSAWTKFCVGAAHAGDNPFPSEVEFGRLDGRVYAEIL
jgi:hypothetical protein